MADPPKGDRAASRSAKPKVSRCKGGEWKAVLTLSDGTQISAGGDTMGEAIRNWVARYGSGAKGGGG